MHRVFDRGQVEYHSVPSHNPYRSVERIVKSVKTDKITEERYHMVCSGSLVPGGLKEPVYAVISLSLAVACQTVSVWDRFSWRTPVSVTLPASSSVRELSDTNLAHLSWCAPAHLLLWFSLTTNYTLMFFSQTKKYPDNAIFLETCTMVILW